MLWYKILLIVIYAVFSAIMIVSIIRTKKALKDKPMSEATKKLRALIYIFIFINILVLITSIILSVSGFLSN